MYSLSSSSLYITIISLGSNQFASNANGVISLYNVNRQIYQEGLYNTTYAINCLTIGNEPNVFHVGHSNGKIGTYDINNMSSPLYTIRAYEDTGISCIYKGVNDTFVTGGLDGTLKLWDIRTKECVLSLIAGGKRSCRSAYLTNPFNDSEDCIIAGYDTGDVLIYDIRSKHPRFRVTFDVGITDFAFNDNGPKKMCIARETPKFHVVDLDASDKQQKFVSIDGECKYDENDPFYSSGKPAASINTCVRFLPQSSNMFVVGSGDGSHSLMKYQDIENNKDIEDKKDFGLCSTVVTNKESFGPVKTIQWYNNQPIFASCTDSSIQVIEITNL